MPIWTKELLTELQSMSLDEKIEMTQDRIEDWYMQFNGNVYVSFSGGKDSTVLLHLVRSMFPEVPAVFCNTGLEFPELKRFAEGQKNVRTLRPKMPFNEVITKYGYPLVSKEVAEAIYYARRIRPEKLRGGGTQLRKRLELTGRRSVGGENRRTAKEPPRLMETRRKQLEFLGYLGHGDYSVGRPRETEPSPG